jgi:rubrerythrin
LDPWALCTRGAGTTLTRVDPETERSIDHVLGICLRIELAASQLYELLSNVHAADAEMLQLWKKMAREEESHAAQFRLALASPSMLETVTIDGAEADGMLKKLDTLIAAYRTSPPTPAQALAASIELEDELSLLHMSTVGTFAAKKHASLFEAMMAADRGHRDGLAVALRRRSP